MKTFNKEKHEYRIDGKLVTGITSIINVLAKPSLIQWSANEAVKYIKQNLNLDEIRGIEKDTAETVLRGILQEAKYAHKKKKESAGEHGTNTHALVEQWINEHISGNRNDTDYTAIQPFIDWAQDNVEKFLFSERQMFNDKLWIAGTADFGCITKDGKRLMGDFKTSSGIYGIDYFLQLAGYVILAEGERDDERYDGGVIFRIGKDGKHEVQYRYDLTADKEAFLACLTLYRIQATFIIKNKKKYDTKTYNNKSV